MIPQPTANILGGPDAAGRALVLVYNPVAGGRRRRRLRAVLAALAARGVPVRLAETTAPGEAIGLARAAVAAGAATVVAAGGDGTINEVANGIAGSGAVLGIVPLGTANVVAHELCLPFAPGRLATMLAAGRTLALRPGLAEGAALANRAPRLFLQMLGAGFDAALVAAVRNGEKRWLGKGAYVIETLRQLRRCPMPRLTLRIDDGPELDAAGLVIAKGHFYGGRFVLCPAARPWQRGFEAALFERGSAGAVLRYALAMAAGRLARRADPRLVAARRLEVMAPAGIPLQADGEAIGDTPVQVRDAETLLPVIVP